MPLPEETKLKLFLEIMACSMPIFKDKTVIILMILITVFDLDSDETVKRIKNRFLNILKNYLDEHTMNEVGFDMQNINKCISALLSINRIFKEMIEPKKTQHKNDVEGTSAVQNNI